MSTLELQIGLGIDISFSRTRLAAWSEMSSKMVVFMEDDDGGANGECDKSLRLCSMDFS